MRWSVAGIFDHQGCGCGCFMVGQVSRAVKQGDVIGNMALGVLQVSEKKKNAPFPGKAVHEPAPAWLTILCE